MCQVYVWSEKKNNAHKWDDNLARIFVVMNRWVIFLSKRQKKCGWEMLKKTQSKWQVSFLWESWEHFSFCRTILRTTVPAYSTIGTTRKVNCSTALDIRIFQLLKKYQNFQLCGHKIWLSLDSCQMYVWRQRKVLILLSHQIISLHLICHNCTRRHQIKKWHSSCIEDFILILGKHWSQVIVKTKMPFEKKIW